MKFLVRSGWGESLALARRLEAEGNEVRLCIAAPEAKLVGDGLIRKTNDFIGSVAWADVVIYDSNSLNLPAEAERLRGAKKAVVGTSKVADQLENDREFALNVAREAGLEVPDHVSFSGRGAFDKAREFLSDRDEDEGWVWKPNDNEAKVSSTYVAKDIPELLRMLSYYEHEYAIQKGPRKVAPDFILTPKIDGFEVSTEAWFNGEDFFLVNNTIEKNRFFPDDLGEKTGCAGNAVWAYSGEEAAPLFKELIAPVRRYIRGRYNGPIDVNAMIERETNAPFFLEFTPRLGYDAIFSLAHLVDDLGSLFAATARGQPWSGKITTDSFAGAIRVHIPPYPEHEENGARGVPIFGFDPDTVSKSQHPCEVRISEAGDAETSGPDGIPFVFTALGGSPQGCMDAALEATKAVKIPLMRYRTDMAGPMSRCYDSLVGTGWVRPTGRRVFKFAR